jgi:hypothetical protein
MLVISFLLESKEIDLLEMGMNALPHFLLTRSIFQRQFKINLSNLVVFID